MAKRVRTELIMPLKTYLQMFVARSPEREPRRLEGEIELGKRFSLSRPTVHSVLERLEAEHWIQHLPGRRGYYTNPVKSEPGRNVIGILSGNADARFDLPQYLAAVAGEITDGRTFLHFIQLCPGADDEIYAQIRNFDYTGILWSDPDPKFYPAIERLIADGVPVVASFLYGTEARFPEENIVLLDISRFVEICWKTIREGKYKHILYYTQTEYFFHCHRKKASGDVRYEWLREADELEKQFREDPPDMILADGGIERYRELFQILEAWTGPLPDIYYYPQNVSLMSSECERRLSGHLFPVPREERHTQKNGGFNHGKAAIRKLLRLIGKQKKGEL